MEGHHAAALLPLAHAPERQGYPSYCMTKRQQDEKSSLTLDYPGDASRGGGGEDPVLHVWRFRSSLPVNRSRFTSGV
jgi:hypothetical protein